MEKLFASRVMKNNLATKIYTPMAYSENTNLRPECREFVKTGGSETPLNLPLQRGVNHSQGFGLTNKFFNQSCDIID